MSPKRTKVINFFRAWWPLFLILALASLLRIGHLLHRGDFWFDEMYSAHFSALPWREFIRYAIIETNPPFWALIARGWMYLFGNAETIFRLPSLVASFGTIILIYVAAQKIFSRASAVGGALVISLSALHIYQSTEARVYGIFVFLATLSFWLFHQIIFEKKTSRAVYWGYFAVQLALVYSHLTALLIPLLQTGFVWYFAPANKKKLLAVNSGALLIWAAWFLPSLLYKMDASATGGWYFQNIAYTSNIFTAIGGLFINSNIPNLGTVDNQMVFTLLSAVLIGGLFFILKKFTGENPERKKLLVYLLLWALMPPLLGSLSGNPISKFFTFTIPAYCLLFGYVINKLNRRTAVVAIVAVSALLLPSALTLSNQPIIRWSSLISHIDERQPAAILITPFHEELVFKNYYHGRHPVMGIFPPAKPQKLEDRVALYNWKKFDVPNEDLNEWMKTATDGKQVIYYLQYGLTPILPLEWLEKNNWKIIAKNRVEGLLQIYIYELHAPAHNSATTEEK